MMLCWSIELIVSGCLLYWLLVAAAVAVAVTVVACGRGCDHDCAGTFPCVGCWCVLVACDRVSAGATVLLLSETMTCRFGCLMGTWVTPDHGRGTYFFI